MNYRLPLLLAFAFVFSFSVAQSPAKKEHQRMADMGNGYFQNPILGGDYPDPSVLRVGSDYYLTHSSFHYYPGLLVWHSKDLVNWEPLTHALHKNVGSVYAPDLVKYGDTYYIYFPANRTNWVVTATSPAGPWSDPIDLKVGGIDPGHITDKQGNRYLHLSDGGFVQLAKDGLSIVGEVKDVYDGWPIPDSLNVECFCLESPKLTYRDPWYYLTVAEGGTAGPATSHMVVSARSASPGGPWENSPYNPIVHTESRQEKWWSKGHGTLVDDTNGNWWIMYHGYEKHFHTLGRQTLMEPIAWTKDGWFKVPGDVKTAEPIRKPAGPVVPTGMQLSDEFNGPHLGLQWQFFKGYEPGRISLNNGKLQLQAKGKSLAESASLLCIPVNHSYTIETEVDVSDGTTAGLTLFYNEKANCGIGLDQNNIYVIRQERTYRFAKNTVGNHAFLKLENRENDIFFYYSADGKNWTRADKSLGVAGFNHNTFHEFLSLRAGVFAFGSGQASFGYFHYQGDSGSR